jgi:hypothetical protein
MKPFLMALAFVPLSAAGQERDIQQALIQRDRQSAEFARPELRELHLRQDLEYRPLRPDERVLQAQEREAFRPEAKPMPVPNYVPLPLPGGPRHGVDAVTVQGVGG